MNLKKIKSLIIQEGIQIINDEKAARQNQKRIKNEIAIAKQQMEQKRKDMRLIRNK
ncbi:hypothetical protein SAFG77S_09092 [Streptomyces afghaniensis]